MTMHRASFGVAAIWMSGVFALPVCHAAGLDRPSGAIIGIVSATNGVAQMGATVSLYNRFDRLVKTMSTTERGAFGFDGLIPDRYSLRVNLSSFMPAFRQGVEVQAGNRTFLAIQLAGVLSSIEFVYNGQATSGLMNDDWKWVLRSSMSTRPALRYLPGWNVGTNTHAESKSVFSSNRGMLKLSAGDDSGGGNFGSQPDLGTAFAFATSLLGTNQLQFSGNVGYASRAGLPAAGFRTRYKRSGTEFGGISSAPEVQLTMRQVFSPSRAGFGLPGTGHETPIFRTLSSSFIDRVTFFDGAELLYGAAIESVTFLERLNYVSPYARLSVAAGKDTSIRVAYSSGLPPEEIYTAAATRHNDTTGADKDMQQDVSALSMFPRVSSRNGRIRVQRSTNLEFGVERKFGKGEFTAVAWHEDVSNGAISALGDLSILDSSDVLPDMFNRSSIVNIGNYARQGYMAGYTHRFNEKLSVTGGYGNNGTLKNEPIELTSSNLRGAFRHGRSQWAYARASAVLPVAATRMSASYQFADYTVLMPMHRTLTGNLSPEMGLNIQLRQPLPSFGIWNGRLEAMGELRNMLGQGYIPVTGSDGRTLLLMQAPKTVRGGLNFIF